MAIGILPAVACPSTATAPSDTVAERLGFAQTSFVPCWRVRCHAFLRFSTFIVFVGAIAVVAVGAAEPSVVVDGTALVFRLPRFLYGRGDAGLGRLSGTIFDASAVPQTWTDAKWQSILAYLRNGGSNDARPWPQYGLLWSAGWSPWFALRIYMKYALDPHAYDYYQRARNPSKV
ncbi:hypothetical protein EMIHUDRAFT_234541 [Emiliania huxleyi CCMP1516]|uniref:Uncharacterized protein n=2 Tax=Emiliania huxleyi TaxID=2903 RepID=A0A0D3JZC0_EMIH1|nr:hypothetical protein EMIHUDRAFT_234541 [Emiliania huxleyi CCMP1516]EOD28855.1 hypothetical protein EMIHUDRAFT_234541 [Emiliania huxleyi CCMP1516]|eukprot:XP_005781284.1 hypothetical protein EMIHUDRAFT_234541 [Emiliania huxleyi CCMP1516]